MTDFSDWLEPEDIGDDEYPDVDGLTYEELIELHEVLSWENAVALDEGEFPPHPAFSVLAEVAEAPVVALATPFISRAQMGFPAPLCSSTNFRLEGLTLHYAGPSPWGSSVDRSSAAAFQRTANHSQCASKWRAMRDYHVRARGGCDIFYHGAGCPHGYRLEGRRRGQRSGAQGTNSGNFRSVGIQTLTGVGDPLTNASKIALLDWEPYFGVPFRWPHQAWKPTSCPGAPQMAWYRLGFPRPGGSTPPPKDWLEMATQREVEDALIKALDRYNFNGRVAMITAAQVINGLKGLVGPNRSLAKLAETPEWLRLTYERALALWQQAGSPPIRDR